MNIKENTGSKKTMMALLVTVLGVVGLVLGLLMKTPVFDTFSAGTWICFVAFLLSLACVQERGRNFMAKVAFWVSFISMSATVFVSALR